VLVRGALEAARSAGKTVIATCPFAISHIDRHPELDEFLAPYARRRTHERTDPVGLTARPDSGGIDAMTLSCTHLDQAELTELPDAIPGCEDCLAIGGRWVHLRMCQSCGHIACCDSSPNRHASAHARSAEHPVARSAEPGETWSWCYIDQVAFVIEPPSAL
jgi:ubiquitin-hydrolase Zn-finger-containing protein